MAAEIQTSIAGYVSAVTALNTAVFNAFQSHAAAALPSCCGINDAQTDARFRTQVYIRRHAARALIV